jgi:beta-aspartyl-dipeptidase (metallo-type)
LHEETEIPARVLQPTHCNRNPQLWQESLELGARGLPIDVTAFPPDDDDEAMPAARAVEMWLDLGLPTDRLTLSSDGGGCLPVWDRDGAMVRMDVGSSATLLGTVATLHRAGRDLADVLPLLTRNVARQLRLRGKGEVAVGADADLLVLDDDFRVQHLLARGRPMIRAGEPVVLGPFEVGGGAA